MNIFQKLHLAINSISPIPIFHPFKMTKAEKRLIDKIIAKSQHYLEFGMGGSTFFVLQRSSAHVYAVDSSEEWIALMRRFKFIRNKEKQGRVDLNYVSIGPTGRWGRPQGMEFRDLFPNYTAEIFKRIDPKLIDTVLVDGRFRVACALKSLLHCGSNENFTVLIHDFERPRYHSVLEFFDIAEQADRLAALKVKKDVDLKAVQAMYDEYKFNND